jgi:hypothetical protein
MSPNHRSDASSRWPPSGLVLLILAVALGWAPVHARAQFDGATCISRTPSNASVILPSDLEIVVDGAAVTGRVQVGVFTARGTCVGATTWAGEATALVAWGAAEEAGSVGMPAGAAAEEALAPGDTMQVRLWDPLTGTRHPPAAGQVALTFRAGAPHLVSHPRYVPNGIYVLDRIRVSRDLAGRRR